MKIKLENIHFKYDEKEILNDVSASIDNNEFVG